MVMLSSFVAVAALFGVVALSPVIGGAIFVLLLFGLFGLALVGVLSGVEDRTVAQHDPAMEPSRWRNGA